MIKSFILQHISERKISCTNEFVDSDHIDVALVSMPFGPLHSPSIGLSLLKATLAPLPVSTYIFYFTLRFASLIGPSLYIDIAEGRPDFTDLIGEWLFSGALSTDGEQQVNEYLEQVLRRKNPIYKYSHNRRPAVEETFIQQLLAVRQQVESFLDQCVAELLLCQPKIVGFTSVFQQQIASLALAKRLKERIPQICIVFGGANCEGVMGISVVQNFPFVDAVVSGEGDLVFPELVQRVLAGKSLSCLQGVYTHEKLNLSVMNKSYTNARSVYNLDDLPFPDYDDFFTQWQESAIEKQAQDLGLEKQLQPRILFETSRGCWWGEKHHCTFCGLNGSTMMFRSKSPQRALDELVTLTTKYPTALVGVVDNILDIKYFRSFIPELARRRLPTELFYEVKANLKKEQLRQLRDAGIRTIQPGIESLSTHVLELMNKGVKGLQNIQLLKWCEELGIKALWNILWGFPGEQPNDYKHIADLIPLLTHLRPPRAGGPIRLDRFSPNFDNAARFGFVDVTPYPAYRYIYPPSVKCIDDMAYCFMFRYAQPQDVETYIQPMIEQTLAWIRDYQHSHLWFIEKGEYLLIRDQRPIAHKPLIILSGLQKLLYLACDRIRSLRQLQELVGEQGIGTVSLQEIVDSLQPILEDGLMIQERDAYLSLAISYSVPKE